MMTLMIFLKTLEIKIMARKERNDIDYFPHSVTHGKKMFYLRSKYGNDGYAVWFMLLENLGKASYHYLNLSDEVELMYLSSELKVSDIVLKEIIEALVKLGEFDKELWEDNAILFNAKFIENISDAYKKRNNDCIDRNSLLLLLDSLGIRKLDKSNPKPDNGLPKVVGNPQRKEKDTKLDYTKEKETGIILELYPTFKNFYDLYGIKKGKDKCLKVWKTLRQEVKEKIMLHIPLYKEEQPDPQFRKHPTTYLNNKSWNDEIITKPKPQSRTEKFLSKIDPSIFEIKG